MIIPGGWNYGSGDGRQETANMVFLEGQETGERMVRVFLTCQLSGLLINSYRAWHAKLPSPVSCLPTGMQCL